MYCQESGFSVQSKEVKGNYTEMKKRILHIEDNPNNRRVVKRILESEGYEVLEAVDGETGWTMIVNERPDLVFMDLALPGVGGLELTRTIKADPKLASIPIIALTAHGDIDVERVALSAGCDGFMHKPADLEAFRKTLAEYFDVSTVD